MIKYTLKPEYEYTLYDTDAEMHNIQQAVLAVSLAASMLENCRDADGNKAFAREMSWLISDVNHLYGKLVEFQIYAEDKVREGEI